MLSELLGLNFKLCSKEYNKNFALHLIVAPQLSSGFRHHYSTKTRPTGHTDEQSMYSLTSMVLAYLSVNLGCWGQPFGWHSVFFFEGDVEQNVKMSSKERASYFLNSISKQYLFYSFLENIFSSFLSFSKSNLYFNFNLVGHLAPRHSSYWHSA